MMKTCKHCKKQVSAGHYCEVAGRDIPYSDSDNDDGDFLLSAAIGAATNSAVLGAVLGGDISGAIIGDLLNGGDLFD